MPAVPLAVTNALPMSRLLPLALLLCLPAVAPATPPEPVVPASGRMVQLHDEVSEGLQKYRRETDPQRRAEWLLWLAMARDPRAAVALGEALGDPSEQLRTTAACLIIHRERLN